MIPTAKEIMCQLENEVIWDTEGVILTDWRKDIEQAQRRRCMEAAVAWHAKQIDSPQPVTLAEAILNAREGRMIWQS